jgi:putative membrane protein
MDREKEKWFQVALRLRGSVISAVLPRVILCGSFGFFVALLHKFGVSVSMPFLSALIPNIVLGLLLVFRTNTAYERFWEGRKAWGSIVNTVRNLSRQIWVSIDEKEPKDRENKISALRLLIAFAIATKLHLRAEPVHSELEPFMSQSRYFKLKTMNNPPLEVAFWIGDYLQDQYKHKHLNAHQLTALQSLINILVDNLGACERILRTPIPIAYAIHLKQLLLLYCLALPFQMVRDLTWWTGPIVALISFTLFGIEEIGIEIENPFGHDANDLPLDAICATMKRNIEDLISLAPSVRDWNKTEIEQME